MMDQSLPQHLPVSALVLAALIAIISGCDQQELVTPTYSDHTLPYSTGFDVEWKHEFQIDSGARPVGVAVLDNGDIYVTGGYYPHPEKLQSSFLMKLDRNGDSLWIRKFNTDRYDAGQRIFIRPNGDVIVVAETLFPTRPEIRLLRYSADGELLQEMVLKLSRLRDYFIEEAVVSTDENLVICGYGKGAEEIEAFVIKVTFDFTILWERILRSDEPQTFGWSVAPAPDGGCVVSTTGDIPSRSPDTKTSEIGHGYVTRLDASGETLWRVELPAFHTQFQQAVGNIGEHYAVMSAWLSTIRKGFITMISDDGVILRHDTTLTMPSLRGVETVLQYNDGLVALTYNFQLEAFDSDNNHIVSGGVEGTRSWGHEHMTIHNGTHLIVVGNDDASMSNPFFVARLKPL